MRFTLGRIKLFYVRFVTNNISLQHVNRKSKIQRFGHQYTVFPDFLSTQNIVPSY